MRAIIELATVAFLLMVVAVAIAGPVKELAKVGFSVLELRPLDARHGLFRYDGDTVPERARGWTHSVK